MQVEASALRRVKTKLARLGDRLRRDEEQEVGGDLQVLDNEQQPTNRAGVPRHLLRHILYRGGSASTTGAEGDGDSCDSDTELDSSNKPNRLPHLSRNSDTEYQPVSGEDNSDDESVSKARTEASSPQPTQRGLRTCGIRRPLLPPRAATLAECQSPPPLIVDEGPSSAPDIPLPEGSILEKLGQRLKERSDKVHRYFQRNTKLCDVNRRLKSQIWSSVVTIVLVEGKNLLPMDIDGFSDPYAKFRLGNEKYKSKVTYKSLNPSWLEQFDLHLYDDQSQELEVTIWDKDRSKDDFMGRCTIDLSCLEREKTHRIWQDLEEGAGSIFLLLTISGTTASETISDLTTYEENPRERETLQNRYAFLRTLQNLRDVGHLTVKVFRAQGLAAADLGGKSDPFCVLELVNARLQTQTEYKTLTPSWQKIFTFNVKDINSVLEVTVYDEDRDHKVEFLGKVAIPLLRIRNGEKKWYSLKDKKLHGRAKGSCPQILLEMTVLWNPIRASIRTLNPKEDKYMQTEVKFKRQVFVRNVMRLKAIIMFFIELGKFIQSCFEWESTPRSIVALVTFIVLCYYFEPYMIPIVMLLIFLKYYVVHVLHKDSISNIIHRLIFNLNCRWNGGKVLSLTGGWTIHDEEEEPLGDEDDDEEDKDKEEKKSLKERLQAIQEVTQSVQNSIGFIASLGESIKNTFNFTVPYLSTLAILMLIAGAVVLYLVSVRYLIMAWGVNKFARKLIRPHTVPNNEILDLLSRVPDDEDLLAFRELKPHPTTDVDRRRDQKKKHKMS
ncbi:multiple C2 and transmembrane domain-containing protein 1 isoform X1 [Zootermopsis nevadensis]|uniref:multiple C2 and transmembrane domain-containing protein 1 isoform X1 n=1 Tax=Zootermopsis nevadensis TaxID=136037 RepID=UPI000B8EC96B|nr:multiple C2 and transmembrane domain-containing protein 1 isoform X1 [Zootermopsis nevadensis]